MKDTDDLTRKLLRLLGITRTRAKKGLDTGKQVGDEELVVIEGTEAEESKTVQPKYELLAMYGFSVNYPNNARLEFDPKSRREKGDLVFHTDDGFKIFLSWGSLAEAKKHYATAAEQASASIKRSLKSSPAKLDGTPETRSMKILDHDATYSHARMLLEWRRFPSGVSRTIRDTYAMHLHCDKSARYYVVYAFGRDSVPEKLRKAIEPIMSSLKCH
jgi:hypothetical protein